ncbi:MAG: DUF2085 domain-containing protein [Candidatus Aminicenantes bacterium]|nr:DUF2085 domain-containing protein [Candidatus Aminicenantes bacterium]
MKTGRGYGVRLLYLFFLAGAALLAAAPFLAPWLAAHDQDPADALYGTFSHVCHQIPSRCLRVFGRPTAVCGRCLGVYLGILAGALAYPFLRGLGGTKLPERRVFLALSLPLAADVLGNFFRLWNSGTWVRLAAGFSWSVVLPFFILPALTEIVLRLEKRRGGRNPGGGLHFSGRQNTISPAKRTPHGAE